MITIRFAIGIEADCTTVDEAVELLTRWQERPRVVEILRARAPRASGNATSSPGTLIEAIQEFQRAAPNAFEDVDAALAEVDRLPTTCCERTPCTCLLTSEVAPIRDTTPAPAPEPDDAAEQREAEAFELMPDVPRYDSESTQPRKRTRSEIMRDNWAKRRAAKGESPPEGSEAAKRRAACVENPEGLPDVRRDAYGNPRGCGAAILTAFSRDERYPLPKLARHIFGSDSTACTIRLRSMLGREFIGKLEPLGHDAYRVTRCGAEALRIARESAERVARANGAEAAE